MKLQNIWLVDLIGIMIVSLAPHVFMPRLATTFVSIAFISNPFKYGFKFYRTFCKKPFFSFYELQLDVICSIALNVMSAINKFYDELPILNALTNAGIISVEHVHKTTFSNIPIIFWYSFVWFASMYKSNNGLV